MLVNNAAVDFVRDILDTDRADLERVFAANFFGAFAMLRECGRVMRNQGAGSIVNVTSRNASVGVPSMGAYAAAKGALLSLTRIAATIFCERPGQKGILIGRGGAMLKMIGTDARREIERLLDVKIFLELFVKVREAWRDSRSFFVHSA